MRTAFRTFLMTVLLSLGALSAQAEDLWLHVRVDEGGESKVTINLPMNLFEAAMPMIPDDVMASGRVDLGDVDVTVEQLRGLWSELKNGPDMTFITVKDRNEAVRVWKETGYLYVTAHDERDESVDIRIPMQVVDALLSGSGNEFNVRAAIRALVDQGEGELVTVTGDDEHVRVWVDGIAEAD